jgi:hypothetical protein
MMIQGGKVVTTIAALQTQTHNFNQCAIGLALLNAAHLTTAHQPTPYHHVTQVVLQLI